MTIVKAKAWLPDLEGTRRLSQSLAVLDAVLCPEWEYRYFSFNASWAPGEMLASMRNGEGDDWLILFSSQGAILKGFDHEATMAENSPWPGVLDRVPDELHDFLNDPAFSMQTTFCLWRRPEDSDWGVGDIEFPAGPDPDGALRLLRFLDGQPETYRRWGEEYFGSRINPQAIEHVYAHRRLNNFVVRSLNPEVAFEEVLKEIQEIGYPA